MTPYVGRRWAATVLMLAVFLLRVMLSQGWYFVTYTLGTSHIDIYYELVVVNLPIFYLMIPN